MPKMHTELEKQLLAELAAIRVAAEKEPTTEIIEARLLKMRVRLSRETHWSGYCFFNNVQAHAIAEAKPSSWEELEAVRPGIGAKKIEKYGDDILDCVVRPIKKAQPKNAQV